MKLTECLSAELDREVEKSRRALEQTPTGKYDWKPHEKSMIFGYLVNMVATIPSWVTMQINQNELDIAPVGAGNVEQKVVMEAPRHEMIQDTINHWSHHGGQMTVYLRLMGAKVPAIYGASADDNQFL